MKSIIIILFLLFLNLYSYSLNYISTGKSTALYGAHSSTADGFEAMLYNPAGLFMTDSKFGFNFLGSYGIRYFSNSISTDEILDFLLALKQGRNLTRSGVIDELLQFIPDYGFDIGLSASAANIMVYRKFKEFALGISFMPKADITFYGTKSIISSFFKELNLTKKVEFETKFTALQYLDLNISLSTRAKFLEEKMDAVDEIYVGLSQHIYFPTLFLKSNSQFSMDAGAADADGKIDKYNVNMKTDLLLGGYLIGAFNSIPFFSDKYGDRLLNNKTGSGIGFGYDMGFIVKFNDLIKTGFSITDLGFILFPTAVHADIDNSKEVGFSSMGAVGDALANGMIGSVDSDDKVEEKIYVWMPSTSIRAGVSINPLVKRRYLLTVISDISVSDFNRILNKEYAAFSISTGLELKPTHKYFSFPIRTAFNYNTQANVGSFALGFGVYYKAFHFDLGIKGLEVFLYDVGAKEFCLAFDFTCVY